MQEFVSNMPFCSRKIHISRRVPVGKKPFQEFECPFGRGEIQTFVRCVNAPHVGPDGNRRKPRNRISNHAALQPEFASLRKEKKQKR